MSTSIHYYIWYRIHGDPAEVRHAVNAVLHDVALTCAVSGKLFVRLDEPSTWMETYEPVTDAASFEVALLAAVTRHGLDRMAVGGRHVERFIVAP